ncbi:hypothetical protein GCM10011452_07930 [Gemmobacter lanyuensis]|uniref:Cytochrome C oxidase assembly protein n=1 Tax=Gemmobacter lanyuensis TaxID=1054497 RepID=A0A918INH7_9RHOB|nr:hypothetical protein [Gemmobacter lanyuensis]GGW23322.1 hypothetical protein GCM10011452_07930 [Gemmobacter lanyuensis]
MTIRTEHEIHQRRFGRNLGLGLTLVAFVALVFGLTVVKVTNGDPMRGLMPAHAPAAAPEGQGGNG